MSEHLSRGDAGAVVLLLIVLAELAKRVAHGAERVWDVVAVIIFLLAYFIWSYIKTRFFDY